MSAEVAPFPKSSRLSGVERQRRHRSARDLVSIDVSRDTLELIRVLRRRTKLTNDGVIAAAAEALATTLEKAGPAHRRVVSNKVRNIAGPQCRHEQLTSVPPAAESGKSRSASSPGDSVPRGLQDGRGRSRHPNDASPKAARGTIRQPQRQETFDFG